MSKKKCFALNEAIYDLDNLEGSTDNSDSEDDSSSPSAKIFFNFQ